MSYARVSCDFCGNLIDPADPGTFPRVTAYVNNNRYKGANAVFFPTAPSGYACWLCLERKKHHIPTGQEVLLRP